MAGGRDEREHDERPSIGELREGVARAQRIVGTGWPVLDELSGGIPLSTTTAVRAPHPLRLQVLARIAAWTAGEGYPTILASHSATSEELWLAAGAGGLGLPPRALLSTRAHDAWVDDRLRVIDLRVFGGADAAPDTAESFTARPASVLILDDYLGWRMQWDEALDPRFESLHFRQWPRTHGCALVVGLPGMEDFSDWVSRGARTLRISPDTTMVAAVSFNDGGPSQLRRVPLVDGFLQPPPPGADLIATPGVTNIWQDASSREISDFATTLGGHVTQVVWEAEDDGPTPA